MFYNLELSMMSLEFSPCSETHQRYTIKRYSSEKKLLDGERWGHSKITLSPDNKEFKGIILKDVSEDDFKVIAEFIQVLG